MITKSARKAHRQNIKRREKNSKVKELVRKSVKNFKKLIDGGKLDEAKKELPKVYKILDKASKSNVFKKNKSARLKSRLSKSLNKKK
ncbi:30S ribosomal protein S20 [Candidatus Wolfebacteria bacterium]|nr:30S ribosomal protein S20 [Candidatus Wolfebacteria bacterium]